MIQGIWAHLEQKGPASWDITIKKAIKTEDGWEFGKEFVGARRGDLHQGDIFLWLSRLTTRSISPDGIEYVLVGMVIDCEDEE